MELMYSTFGISLKMHDGHLLKSKLVKLTHKTH